MPTRLPERPWQNLGADLFTLKDKNYLLVVDYFSRYVEIAQLSPTRSANVIVHLKSIFARHGIPEVLITDNGPQFACQEMRDFAKDYCFEHVTSSPRYPQSNGEAERGVQTVKNLLKKASDPYKALLAYRTTALANGYSPAQLLMGRRLRTTLPMLPETLQPRLPDFQQVSCSEREKRLRQTESFNKRHRTRELDKLVPGQPVWITDARAQGTVTAVHPTPRSYVISGPQGTIRRNRSHLVPIPQTEAQTEATQIQATPTETVSEPSAPHTPGVVRTRSGREVIKPKRLDL